jgi:hypothetical protein
MRQLFYELRALFQGTLSPKRAQQMEECGKRLGLSCPPFVQGDTTLLFMWKDTVFQGPNEASALRTIRSK